MARAYDWESGYAGANGTSFHYERAGAGEPLVLLHAGIADQRMWDGQVPVFAQHYDVIRYDARGYGNTHAGAGRYSRSQDLYGLMMVLGVERAVLLGSSQGGTDAIDFALEHPAMAAGLALVSAVPSGYQLQGEPPRRVLEFMSAYQQRDLERASELAAQVWLDGPHRTPDQMDPHIRGWVRNMMRDVLAAGAMDTTGEEPSSEPAVGRLSELRVPTLVVVGDQDDPSILQAGERMTSEIPGAEKLVICGAAHLLNIEKPEEFNRVVLDFLRRTY